MDPSSSTYLPIILLIIAAVFLLLLIILIVLLLRRREGGGDTMKTIASRLDRIEEVSGRLEDLSKIFLIPYSRGGIGETFLAELLRNWLPSKAFSLQYGFKDGTRVDAVVRLGKSLVPVDSKFPLESVQRSMAEEKGSSLPGELKRAFLRHIDDIATKYIRPAEGTLDFALMYIPSEMVYYRVFVEASDNILPEALSKNVVPVSPGTLFLYLQTVAYGLRGFEFPKAKQELIRLIRQLKVETGLLSKNFSVSGTHLKNLQKSLDDGALRLRKLEFTLERLGGGSEEFSFNSNES